ncbi:hypothetical protein [Streptomyces sp. NPDC101115]
MLDNTEARRMPNPIVPTCRLQLPGIGEVVGRNPGGERLRSSPRCG